MIVKHTEATVRVVNESFLWIGSYQRIGWTGSHKPMPNRESTIHWTVYFEHNRLEMCLEAVSELVEIWNNVQLL